MEIVNRIFALMESNSINAARLTREVPLTNGLITQWKQGKQKPSIDAVIKLSRYFNVSTDYLLTGEIPRNEFSINDVQSNNGIIGQANAPLTINNGNDKKDLSEEEIELLRIYKNLDLKKRIKMLSTAIELEEEMK